MQFDHKYYFLLLPRPNKYPQTAAVSEVSISLAQDKLVVDEFGKRITAIQMVTKSREQVSVTLKKIVSLRRCCCASAS